MTKEREIAGVKVFVSKEAYNEYKGTLEEQLEEKDKEIERLSKEVDMWNRKYNEQIDIINELEKYLYNEYLEWKDSENQSLVDKAFEDKEIYDYLKELKEGK